MRPVKWTESAIKQAFDDFIKEYDRLPTSQEMYGKYNGRFPRPLSVKICLGVTLGEYLETNYTTFRHRCQSRIYNKMTKEYWIDNFRMQYTKFGMPPKLEYDKLRDKDTPNSKTLTRIVGVSNWNQLLKICGFNSDNKPKLVGEMIFEETLENYQKLRKKLQSLLW